MKPHELIIREIARERERQMTVEGYTPAHDDQHGNAELGRAAAYYAAHAAAFTYRDGPDHDLLMAINRLWPWDPGRRKPSHPRHNLMRAAALIVAEIERLDRSLPKPEKTK